LQHLDVEGEAGLALLEEESSDVTKQEAEVPIMRM